MMKNRVITSLLLVIVLCISIGFAIINIPFPNDAPTTYRDSFEYNTNHSDIHTTDSKNVIISTEDMVETYSSSEQNTTSQESGSKISDVVPSASVVVPSLSNSADSSEHSYNSFFDGDDDIFDNQDFTKEVYVSVKGIDDYLAKGYVEFESGDTVFDVTKELLDKNKIELKRRGAGATVYVYKIGDLEEKDYGPLSGWVYTINDERVNAGCGSYKVDIGDVIDWTYQTD